MDSSTLKKKLKKILDLLPDESEIYWTMPDTLHISIKTENGINDYIYKFTTEEDIDLLFNNLSERQEKWLHSLKKENKKK